MVVDEDQDFSDLKEIEVLKVGLHDEKWPTWAQKYTEESSSPTFFESYLESCL